MMTLSTIFFGAAAGVLAAPSPTPTGPGPGGIDWTRIHPDPNAVPFPDLFYTIMNALLYIGGFAAGGAVMAGLIAFGIGPLFGAHIVSDRGRSMMWKGVLIAFGVGSFTVVMAFLLVQ